MEEEEGEIPAFAASVCVCASLIWWWVSREEGGEREREAASFFLCLILQEEERRGLKKKEGPGEERGAPKDLLLQLQLQCIFLESGAERSTTTVTQTEKRAKKKFPFLSLPGLFLGGGGNRRHGHSLLSWK